MFPDRLMTFWNLSLKIDAVYSCVVSSETHTLHTCDIRVLLIILPPIYWCFPVSLRHYLYRPSYNVWAYLAEEKQLEIRSNEDFYDSKSATDCLSEPNSSIIALLIF